MSDNKPIMGYISFGPLDPNAKPITTKANEKVQNAILRWQDLVPEARENVYALLKMYDDNYVVKFNEAVSKGIVQRL